MSENKIEEVVEESAEVLQEIGESIEQKINKGFNQYHFAVLFVLVALAMTLLIAFNGFATPDNIAATVAAQINGIALFFISFFGICLALAGAKINIYVEIIEQHNLALAVFLLGVAYGIASIIAKAAL